MSFKDCLVSAQQQGAITPAEAQDLANRFDELHAQARLELGDGPAAAAAKQRLETQMRFEAARERRLLGLTEQARQRIKRDVTEYRNRKGEADILEGVLGLFEHFGFHGYSSVEGRFKAIVGMAHAEMEAAIYEFRRSWTTGKRQARARLENVVRELHGESTGDELAAALAQTFDRVSDALRQRFNANGGEIPRLEKWGGPQFHDSAAVLRAGREKWKEAIRPRLDPTRMRDPLTGEAPTPARFEQLLDGAYDSIVTNGDIRLQPKGRAHGVGALANQRAEHRFFAFKSADDWLAYAAAFGQGDPFAAMMNHIKGMARDIAALEILGPNPSATVDWLTQAVQLEAGKRAAGRPSLFAAGSELEAQTLAGTIDYRIRTLWQGVRGGEVVNERMAAGFATVRNLITSAVLGSASVTALATDPFIANVAKRLSGLPTSNYLTQLVKTLGYDRREGTRAGLILEDALHLMGQEARYAGTLAGPQWTRALADRVLTWSGLTPWTQARKHIFGMEFQAHIADQLGTAWDDLPDRLRRTMSGYGIDRTDWNVMRAAKPYEPASGATFLRPAEVAGLVDGPGLPKVAKLLGINEADEAARLELARRGVTRTAEKYLEMILSETERAVPSGTKRSAGLLSGGAPAGTIAGEMLRSGLMFKAFGLSFTMLQLQAIGREVADYGKARGAAYAGSMLLSLTMGGALALQLKQIINGKDLQDPSDPRFWLQAIGTGGGFGLYGDFLFADVNRMGHSLGEQLAGPVVGLIGDSIRLTAGNVQELAKGEDETNFGRELVNYGRRYMPTVSLWYLRAAYNRIVFDQLQYLADPDAHRNMREKEKRLQRETGQGFWWQPGELAPSRAPTLSQAP